ncbi:MAG: PEGA domain-containing protein [Candidatus Eremiobacteraeota bacterium]|nr:PEGA domain-containing protein [Candidatus Eremiobacteraeota bacterium]
MEAIFLENYWIKNEIGRGNISIVYMAVNSKTGEDVALKRFFLPHIILESQRKEKFKECRGEIQEIINLEYPNILNVRDLFEEDGNFYLEMELLKGKTLAQINEGSKKYKLDEGVHIFLKCAEALSYTHKKELLHRYLKPSNVFITEEGEVKITDFGTHLFNRDHKNRDVSNEIIPARIIKYFSPEQLKNEDCDVRSDIYSLAAVMYELFTGRSPFGGESRELLEQDILEKEVESPRFLNPKIPELLDYLLVKALNKDPDLRHRDMDELIRDIRHLFQSGNIENTGIRAGHIKKVQGRVAQQVHHVKKGMWDLFKKISPAEKSVEIEEPDTGSGILRKRRKHRKSNDGLEISAPVFEKTVPGRIPTREKHAITPGKKAKKNKKLRKSPMILKGVIVGVLILILVFFGVIFAKKLIESRKNGNNRAGISTQSTPTPVVVKNSGKNGTVIITCNVPSVHIFMQNYYNRNMPPIDRKTGEAGKSVEVEAEPGVYSVRLAKEMYRSYEGRIEVMAGQRKKVKADLERKEPRLQIITIPGGASVYLNHSFYGKTPLTLYDIRYGRYKLHIRKKDYEDLESDINIRSGEPLIINKDLGKIPKGGGRIIKTKKKNNTYVSIFTIPAGATVYIGEKKIGYSPIQKLSHPPGKYTLNIRMAGYRTVNREINIPKGLVRDFFIDMAKIQETASNIKETPPLYSKPDFQSPTPEPVPQSVEKKPVITKPEKLKLMVRLIFTDGIAYDKLSRKVINISFDKKLIANRIERALEGEKDIIITDNGFDTDILMKVHFAVGVNSQSSETKPDLTLYSAVMLSSIRPRKTIFYVHDNAFIPFPSEASVSSSGRGYSSSRLVDRENGTREANAFIESHIGRVLNILKEYKLKMETDESLDIVDVAMINLK